MVLGEYEKHVSAIRGGGRAQEGVGRRLNWCVKGEVAGKWLALRMGLAWCCRGNTVSPAATCTAGGEPGNHRDRDEKT